MPLQINNIFAQNVQPYPVANTAIRTVSNLRPKEGEYCIPMQFDFRTSKVWQVDLSFSLGQKFAQLRSLYIDATNSAIDVIVCFPDTGFQVVTRAGYTNLVSIPNRRFQYVFYVGLVGIVNDPISLVNIIASNVMLPPFNTYNLFVAPKEQLFFQVNNGLLNPSGRNQGGGRNLQLTESNLAIILVGAVSAALYSIRLNIAMAGVPDQLTEGQILATHTVNATRTNIRNDLFGHQCTIDYFFFRDILTTVLPDRAFVSGLNIYGHLLSGVDGGASVSRTYSSLNWTFSGYTP